MKVDIDNEIQQHLYCASTSFDGQRKMFLKIKSSDLGQSAWFAGQRRSPASCNLGDIDDLQQEPQNTEEVPTTLPLQNLLDPLTGREQTSAFSLSGQHLQHNLSSGSSNRQATSLTCQWPTTIKAAVDKVNRGNASIEKCIKKIPLQSLQITCWSLQK